MKWVIGLLICFALLVSGMQILMRLRARRMRGAAAPPLPPHFFPAGGGSDEAMIFYFHSPGCHACRAMTPLLRELAANRKNIFLIDASTDRETAGRFGVMGTPTTIRVAGGKITDFELGPRSRESLIKLISRKA